MHGAVRDTGGSLGGHCLIRGADVRQVVHKRLAICTAAERYGNYRRTRMTGRWRLAGQLRGVLPKTLPTGFAGLVGPNANLS